MRYRKTRSITPDPVVWNMLHKCLPAKDAYGNEIRTASKFFDTAVAEAISRGFLKFK